MRSRMAWNAVLYASFLFLFGTDSFAADYRLLSPQGRIDLTIAIGDRIEYSIRCDGLELIASSPISMILDNGICLGRGGVVSEVIKSEHRGALHPEVREKRAEIPDSYNELTLRLQEPYRLIFRAYDNGVAYRFETSYPNPIRIQSEEAVFRFAPSDTVYFPREESFLSHNERQYEILRMDEIEPGSFCSLPALVKKPSGVNVLLTEAALEDYPGLWLEAKEGLGLSGIHPGVALEEELLWDRTMKVTRSAPYIAETRGTRSFPWRVLAIAETDGDLILNQLVYLLADPCRLEDVSWIRPGKAAWDYWSALNVFGVDFPAGINTDTYRYFIDFASDYGIEYIILDEGWYADGDLLSVTPSIDMEALMAHARRKNVDVILWVTWKALEDQLTPALDRFQAWGVAGIKVDYMQRDDQWMVNYYWKVAREAAKRKMLVDFHGCYKPAGLRRAYPNVLTREGVQGLENCKVTDTLTPKHNLTIPFIRMVAGPMDYTPGAMVNAQKENFRPIFKQPMSLSTRCHQLALFVAYESPLQMLADSPSNYRKEPECMEFLRRVPTVWDETVVLHAKIGDCLALARRSGNEWYVGAMAGETPRDLMLDFSFLGRGQYRIDFYRDGVNAERNASDFKFDTARIDRDSRMTIHLARGGGWAARIYR